MSDDMLDDGFGNQWQKCGPECSMEIVRPGKVQCGPDAPCEREVTLTLRQRIEQRITDLRVERDIAAAVRGSWWTVAELTAIDDDNAMFPEVDATHIATQDPATVIARIDRELAGCVADLALLDISEAWTRLVPNNNMILAAEAVFYHLATRYPSEASS